MNIRIIILAVLLLVVGIAEILTTGTVYNYFGAWKLIIIYTITTSVGAVILVTQNSWVKRNNHNFKNDNEYDDLQKELKEKIFSSEQYSQKTKDFLSLSIQFILYFMAWFSIIIPGLITDIFGFILIAIFFIRKSAIEKLL